MAEQTAEHSDEQLSGRPLLPLVFVGPMAAGKSKIGRIVARALDVPFVDTDKRIAAEHGPIVDIFARDGEATFRAFERHAVSEALSLDAVVSLGGGAVLNEATQADLAQHTVVLLTVNRDAVASRLHGSGRPLLDGSSDVDVSEAEANAAAVERWESIAQQRMPIYESLATVIFDTSGRPISQIADDIVHWARKRS